MTKTDTPPEPTAMTSLPLDTNLDPIPAGGWVANPVRGYADGETTDSQRSKCYAWERGIYASTWGKWYGRNLSKEQVVSLCHAVWALVGLDKPVRWADGRTRLIAPPRVAFTCNSRAHFSPYSFTVAFARRGDDIPTVLHEMAHAVDHVMSTVLHDGRVVAGHGSTFVGWEIVLMAHYAGVTRTALYDSAVKHGLNVTVPMYAVRGPGIQAVVPDASAEQNAEVRVVASKPSGVPECARRRIRGGYLVVEMSDTLQKGLRECGVAGVDVLLYPEGRRTNFKTRKRSDGNGKRWTVTRYIARLDCSQSDPLVGVDWLDLFDRGMLGDMVTRREVEVLWRTLDPRGFGARKAGA